MSAKVERLVNLTVALLEARRPMTFQDIRRRTRYYQQSDAESARRMFERDKDDLRRLGVPVETRSLDAFDTEQGYIVERGAYELPDVDLDADEVAALAVALQLAGDATDRLGLTKLVARAPDPSGAAPTPPARVTLEAEVLDDLADPLVEHRAVAFGYRTATGTATTRTVDPYGVVQRRGAWYLVGRDHDRDALRAFRLDRCTTRLRPTGDAGAFAPPDDLDVRAAVQGPATGEVAASVAVAPGARWEAERQGGLERGEQVDGWPVYRFDGVDADRLTTWVLGLGAQAVVIAPPTLVEEVTRRLRSLAEQPA